MAAAISSLQRKYLICERFHEAIRIFTPQLPYSPPAEFALASKHTIDDQDCLYYSVVNASISGAGLSNGDKSILLEEWISAGYRYKSEVGWYICYWALMLKIERREAEWVHKGYDGMKKRKQKLGTDIEWVWGREWERKITKSMQRINMKLVFTEGVLRELRELAQWGIGLEEVLVELAMEVGEREGAGEAAVLAGDVRATGRRIVVGNKREAAGAQFIKRKGEGDHKMGWSNSECRLVERLSETKKPKKKKKLGEETERDEEMRRKNKQERKVKIEKKKINKEERKEERIKGEQGRKQSQTYTMSNAANEDKIFQPSISTHERNKAEAVDVIVGEIIECEKNRLSNSLNKSELMGGMHTLQHRTAKEVPEPQKTRNWMSTSGEQFNAHKPNEEISGVNSPQYGTFQIGDENRHPKEQIQDISDSRLWNDSAPTPIRFKTVNHCAFSSLGDILVNQEVPYNGAPTSNKAPSLKLNCTCIPHPLIASIPASTKYLKPSAAKELLSQFQIASITPFNLCDPHLRRLSSTAAGLKTSQNLGSIGELRCRLFTVLQNVNRIPDYVMKYNYEWFTKDALERWQASELPSYQIKKELGLYKFKARGGDLPFEFDAEMIFDRFANMIFRTITSNTENKHHLKMLSLSDFRKDGTILVNSFFSYLVDDPEVWPSISDEFDMYRHHLRNDNTFPPAMGFNRIMWHSLIQQSIRQDPAFYALWAACRPDKKWALISYPYYTKDTEIGEKTGFMHFDLNVEEYLRTGKCGNIVQGSVSLDNEDRYGATKVVIGGHRSLREWWETAKTRDANKQRCGKKKKYEGETTEIKKMYLQEDWDKFGDPVPVPCNRGGIRISLPTVAHGSTEVSSQRRRVVFPWYIAIADISEHNKLENPDTETWPQLSTYHRDLEVSMKMTSGRSTASYGRPYYKFPAGIKLPSASAIGDALLAQRRWDDNLVLRELKVLMAEDEDESLRFVMQTRERIKENLKRGYECLREVEMRRFGDKSFWKAKEVGKKWLDMEGDGAKVEMPKGEAGVSEGNTGAGEEMETDSEDE